MTAILILLVLLLGCGDQRICFFNADAGVPDDDTECEPFEP